MRNVIIINAAIIALVMVAVTAEYWTPWSYFVSTLLGFIIGTNL